LFGEFGRTLTETRPKLRLPVAFGIHDGEVLYAPVPRGSYTPKNAPRTVVGAVKASAYYHLGPISYEPSQVTVAAADEMGAAFLASLSRFSLGIDPWSEVVTSAKDVRLRHHSGALEDVVLTEKLNWLVSEPLVRALMAGRAEGDRLPGIRVFVEGQDGNDHAYYWVRPAPAIPSLAFDRRLLVDFSHGRSLPAFRRRDVVDRRVFDERTPYFRMHCVAIVASDVLRTLVMRGVLSGVRAREVVVLEDGELEDLPYVTARPGRQLDRHDEAKSPASGPRLE
jgi:hypothetical protein